MKHIKLFEYFNSNVNDFMRYIKLSDDEKREEIIHNFSFLASRHNFFDDRFNEIEEIVGDIDEIEQLYNEYEEYEIPDILKDKYPAVFELLKDYAYEEMERGGSITDAEKPSWVFLSFENIIKADTWLVHITSEKAARDIVYNGFTKGLSDYGTLGLTTHFGDGAKADGGYNFAYTIPDFIKYARNTDNGGKFRYGESIILFRAAGVRCFHETDDEHQVVFYGETATDIKRLYYDEAAEGRDSGDLNVEELLRKAGRKAILSYINSTDCRYVGNYKKQIADTAELPDCIDALKKLNVEAYRNVYYHFIGKVEKTGEWYLKDTRGKVAYRASEPEDILRWFVQNYRQVK